MCVGNVVAQHPWTSVLLPGHLRGLEVVLAGVVWLGRSPSRARLPSCLQPPKATHSPQVSPKGNLVTPLFVPWKLRSL